MNSNFSSVVICAHWWMDIVRKKHNIIGGTYSIVRNKHMGRTYAHRRDIVRNKLTGGNNRSLWDIILLYSGINISPEYRQTYLTDCSGGR